MESERKYKIHLGILLFSFAIVVTAILYTNRFLLSEKEVSRHPKPVIIENKYLDPWLGFSIEAPSKHWQIERRNQQDEFIDEDSLLSFFTNVQPIVELRKQIDSTHSALVEIAAIKLTTSNDAHSLAARARNDFLARKNYGNVDIVQNIVKTTESRYDAAWFVIHSRDQNDDTIWIITTVTKDSLGYIITSRVDSPAYEQEKTNIEAIVASFRLYNIQLPTQDELTDDDDYEF
ncbi:MAG: hypothetical protein DWQ10_14830 [Calditrichaeota bacterium]|nr:MAG: hypothetical protein DWQ10_14830 [Calditrichota bacterium]